MSRTKISKIFARIKDIQYVKYSTQMYIRKFIVQYYLGKLDFFHKQKEFDFTNVRNRFFEETIRYANAKSRYYHNEFRLLKINMESISKEWIRIPIIDKEIVRKNREKMLCVSIENDYVFLITTGGSTGEPLGVFRWGGFGYEHQKFAFKLMGYQKGDRILAMDGTVVPKSLTENGIFWVKKNNKDLPYGSIALSSQYLKSTNICKYVEFIKNLKPVIIRGYPSFIFSIAEYICDHKIELGFQLKGIQITSESYDDNQINTITEAFKCNVFSQYGHAEGCVFGYSVDNTMRIYCSPLYGFTEIINERNEHVKPFEIGEIVVTGFDNYAMPLIRYRTGDLARFITDRNGVIVLEKIIGRTQDYIYTCKNEKVLLTAVIFGRHYKALDNIKKWQITQNIPGEIMISIIKREEFSIENEIEISQGFSSLAGIKTHFEYVLQLPLTVRGKSRLLVQNIKI